ncbi:putative pentatricopeptide repeat-containing protein At1g64310 [Mercurialis annua]|uniref:putative pentatricopeptide repeat-containing protein At1g64310 n=1 Tax=Mercurialis annua TaxID=3986 RepID=UPI00215E4CF3|nr:putative pentatricopeptide repeat-containing protein At1g64310 [Mercurialis annua]
MPIHFPSLIVELTKPHQTLSRTKQLHSLLITTSHLPRDPFYATKITRFYALNGNLCSARNLFDRTPQPSVFLWNSIIRAYARAHKFYEALFMYKRMLGTEIRPDNFTYACLIRACHENFDIDSLRILHGGVVISGLGFDSVCCSALVTAYSKLNYVSEASIVFARICEPDLVLWNSMISCYSYCGFWSKGLKLFNEMRGDGKQQPDGFSLVGLISGLMEFNLLGIGQGIHGLCLKSGFDFNAYVGGALVSMYARFKCMSSAYNVFSSLSQPDLVAWSALITGYCQSGDHTKAMMLYRNLTIEGRRADPILIASILAAAAHLANLRPGVEIHGYVFRHGYESNIMVSSALINMYMKCGFVRWGIRVFDNTINKNAVSYNSIISGLGFNGISADAFKLFEEMLEQGLKPDESTFSALLCCCCHAGLVKDGWRIFKRMMEDFCIPASTEHYVHMVKLLGSAGQLEEAYNFILSSKQPVDNGIWGALLSCCDIYGNTKLAEIVSQQLFDNEPRKGAYRVMLSNIYAGEGRWDDAKKTRDNLLNAGGRKIPGVSWIGGGQS